MFIGKLARATGLSIPAIRRYEAEGLLEVPRSQTKYRLYDSSHVRQLQFIQMLEGNGFRMPEIARILKSLEEAAPAWDSLTALVTDKIHQTEACRARLETLREAMLTLASRETPQAPRSGSERMAELLMT